MEKRFEDDDRILYKVEQGVGDLPSPESHRAATRKQTSACGGRQVGFGVLCFYVVAIILAAIIMLVLRTRSSDEVPSASLPNDSSGHVFETLPPVLSEEAPTTQPTTAAPTAVPTVMPSSFPSDFPSLVPSISPSAEPTLALNATESPTLLLNNTFDANETSVPSLLNVTDFPTTSPTVESLNETEFLNVTLEPTLVVEENATEAPTTLVATGPHNETQNTTANDG